MAFALIPKCCLVGGSEITLLMFSDRFAVKLTEENDATTSWHSWSVIQK